MFQNQLDAVFAVSTLLIGGLARYQVMDYKPVASDTAFARIFEGKISAGYVQLVGPHVVAKVQTNKYEQATMADETGRLFSTTHVISLDCPELGSLGCP